jgi:hypothetical protein
MKKLIMLMAVFFSLHAWAQNDSVTEEDSIEQQLIDAELGSEESGVAEDDEIVIENNETEEQEQNSNSRFVPTEQISQDLGVSFPVDI